MPHSNVIDMLVARDIDLKDIYPLCVLLACAVLCASSALCAQPRPAVPDRSNVETRSRAQDARAIDARGNESICLPPMINREVIWWTKAWNTICTERVRSDAVALAWAQGLDEHGAQLDADSRASKLTEMELWLRRLVGKFRIEGNRWRTGERSQVRGAAECFGIGKGPGVTCVISAEWAPLLERDKKSSDKNKIYAIRPQILLFGLDPGAMNIRVTHVDSVAVALHGFLLDGSVILRGEQPMLVPFRPGPPPDTSDALPSHPDPAVWDPLSRVAISPDGAVDLKFFVNPPSRISFYYQPIEFDLQLHRETP